MEPQFSVLLYSKYSPLSKKILDIIQSSPVNLEQIVSLQTLCIDNEKVRKRIYQNKQIDITSVPCILVIFPDGGIEKYDGLPAFQWIEEILQKFAPPPPPPQQPQKSLQQIQIEEQRKQKIIKQNKKKLVESQREQERLIQKQKYERHLNKSNSDQIKNSHTNIDDLDSEDEVEDENENNNINENQNDRYRHKKPIGSIREDSGNYSRDDDLFAGDQPDTRQAKKSAFKQPIDASQKKTLDLMAKAKEMEKGRQEPPLPQGHPGRT